jgi:ankyrin repeat protein
LYLYLYLPIDEDLIIDIFSFSSVCSFHCPIIIQTIVHHQDSHGMSPLALCALNGKREAATCVSLLIAAGADPNYNGSEDAAAAAAENEPGGAKNTLLHTLATTRQVGMAGVLLNEGAKLNVLNAEGLTRMREAFMLLIKFEF